MDIDFNDLDGPSKAPPAKSAKFAPKNKFKPAAKLKREPEVPVASSGSIPVVVPKVELDDLKPPQQPPKTETEQPSDIVHTSHDANGSVKMDIDAAAEMEVDNEPQPDDEDRVVREIDVFFSSSADADPKLYVLQYPLRQSWRPYELEERCEKVRVKPETAEVEVEMSVQVNSENFDADADDSKAMPKQVLSSSWKPLSTNGYAVGILVGNELHLNPVHAVVQLRPSMQHLKAQHPSKKMNTTRDEDGVIASAAIKNEKAVKQSKKQIKLPGAVNEQIEDTKEWIPLKYHGAASELSHMYIGKMVAQPTSEIQFSMSQSDYIDSLCPATSDKLRPKGPSRSSLLKLPLEERYKTWLLEGPPVHRFISLKHLAPNDSDEDIFRVLRSHAQLVQGLWVAKSKLKYGMDGGKEVLLRNYVLLQFSKNPIFPESQLPKINKTVQAMEVILAEFATKRDTCRDWKFREQPDDLFIKQYPNLVEEQKKIWDHAEPQIIATLFPEGSKHNFADRRPTSKITNDVAPRTTNVSPSKTLMLDETREALPKALQRLFQVYKAVSVHQIRQRLRDMAVSESTHRKGTQEEVKAATTAAAAPQEELQKALSQVAVNIHGTFVARSSSDLRQYDDLRNIVINLFLAEGPKGRVKKASIFEAANIQLKREITNVEYQKVLNELCVSQNSAWVLRGGELSPK